MDMFKSNRLTSFKGLCIIALLGALAFNSTRAETADTASFRWERLEISNAARVTIIQGNEFRLWVDGSDWTSTLAGQAQGEERGWEIDGEWLRLHKFSAKELKVQQPRLRRFDSRELLLSKAMGYGVMICYESASAVWAMFR